MRRFSVLLVVVLAMTSCDLGGEEPRRALPFTTIAQGRDGGIEAHEPRVMLIRDPAAWSALWTEHTGRMVPGTRKPLPEVDFSRSQVIAVLQTGGPVSDIQIADIRLDGENLAVRVIRPLPEEDCQLPTVVYNYYEFVSSKVTAKELEVRLVVDTPTRACRQ